MAHLYIGIKGTAMAIDRATGEVVWSAPLKGDDFVNVVLDEGQLFAATMGELYCLDPATGQIRWRNGLPGFGWGLITIALAGNGNQVVAAEEKRLRDEADASTVDSGS